MLNLSRFLRFQLCLFRSASYFWVGVFSNFDFLLLAAYLSMSLVIYSKQINNHTWMKSSWSSLLNFSREFSSSFSFWRVSALCLTWTSIEAMIRVVFLSICPRNLAFSSSIYLCRSWNCFLTTHLKTSDSFCMGQNITSITRTVQDLVWVGPMWGWSGHYYNTKMWEIWWPSQCNI